MENIGVNSLSEDNAKGRTIKSPSVQIRLMGHCIICLRKVSGKRKRTCEYYGGDDDPEIAPKSVVSTPGFLATFNQVWTVLQVKWKHKNRSNKDGNGLSEGIEISLENVLQIANCVSANVSFSKAPTICQVCCDKVVAVENLMKAVRQQVQEINILLEEGRRRQDGGLGEFEKSLRKEGLEEGVIRATLQFVGIFDVTGPQKDVQNKVCTVDHASLAPSPPEMALGTSAAPVELDEENELDGSQISSDEDNEGQSISGAEEDDDDGDPEYLIGGPEEDDNDEWTDEEDESDEEMEVDEEEDKYDPDFKVGKDPLANRFPEKRSKRRIWKNKHGSGSCKKKVVIEDGGSRKFPCSCGKSYATFSKLRDHMRKNLDKHPEYKPFSFTKPAEHGSSEDKEKIEISVLPDSNGKFVCSCGKTFDTLENRKNHMRKNRKLHPEYVPFKGVPEMSRQSCELCGERVYQTDLLKHYTDHLDGQEELVMKCPNEKCRYMFVSQRELYVHLRRFKECKISGGKDKTGEGVCEICGFTGKNMLVIKTHLRDKHENGKEKKWRCPINNCGKMFCEKQSFHLHFSQHRFTRTRLTKQVCDKCGEDLKVEEMEGHLKDKHGIEEVIGCGQCEMKFSGRDEMAEHLYEHRGIGIRCDICGEDRFGRYGDFREHYFVVHKLCPKKYRCGEGEGTCDLWFWRKEDKVIHEMNKHQRGGEGGAGSVGVSAKKMKHKCDICEVEYTHEDNLMKHQIRVHGADPLSCDICGETFEEKRTLNKHKKEHAGIVYQKEWSCEVEGCGRIFRRKDYWKHHMEIGHGGKRPHVCEICGKGFTFASSLKGHRDSVHLGLRPWVCDECGEAFTNSSVLKRHKLIHTGERPFGCEICGQRFRHREVLRRHKVGHEEKGADFKPNGPMKQLRKRKAVQ